MIPRLLALTLCVGLAASAAAGPYQELRDKLLHIHSVPDAVRIVAELRVEKDPDIVQALEENSPDMLEKLRALADLKAMAEGAPSASRANAIARQIKRPEVYRDPGVRSGANWLERALEHLKNLMPKFNRTPSGPGLRLGAFVRFILWTAIALVAALVLYLGVRGLKLSKRKKPAPSILESEEPERTVDEWLELVDGMVASGRYREAVRALYVAMLLRLDEAGVARFERSQTNWEHLSRIEASPRRPEALDFRGPTQRFDRVWYGMQPASTEDVHRFREAYGQVVSALQERAGA